MPIPPTNITACRDNNPGWWYWHTSVSLGWSHQSVPPGWPARAQSPGCLRYWGFQGIVLGDATSFSAVVMAPYGVGIRHGLLVRWGIWESWSGPLKISRIDLHSFYNRSGCVALRRKQWRRWALEPGSLVVDGQWMVRLAPLECTSTRVNCRLNQRKEDITNGSYVGSYGDIKG